MSATRDLVLAVRDDLNTAVLDRREAIDLMLITLLARGNCVLLGPPGEAKSYMVRELFRRVLDAQKFDYLLTRFTEPNELFGPIDIRQLEAGVYARITTNSLAVAHLSFLDEVWKANSSILNALLTILNEGYFMMDGQVYQAALESTFGASNEMPEDMELLGALWDRFHIRYQVRPVASESALRGMWDLVEKGSAVSATISLATLVEARREVDAVVIGDDVRDAAIEIKSKLRLEGISVTSRMWTQSMRIIKARAWLAGVDRAGLGHLDILAHSWWDLPTHVAAVQKVVYQIANPLHLQAISLEDTARDIYEAAPKPGDSDFTSKLERSLSQLADMVSALEQKVDKADPGTTMRAEDALDRIGAWHNELAQLMLQTMNRLRLPGAGN